MTIGSRVNQDRAGKWRALLRAGEHSDRAESSVMWHNPTGHRHNSHFLFAHPGPCTRSALFPLPVCPASTVYVGVNTLIIAHNSVSALVALNLAVI